MAYKSKKYHETKYLTTFAVIVAAALIVFLIGIGISRIAGAQNTTVILSNGEEVKFTGMFDKDGNPISGTLYYANGISAEIDVTKGTVTYSDGTVIHINYGTAPATVNGIRLPAKGYAVIAPGAQAIVATAAGK